MTIYNVDIFEENLCTSIKNAMFQLSILPNSLKLAEVTPLHKKGKRLKENYGPVALAWKLYLEFYKIQC